VIAQLEQTTGADPAAEAARRRTFAIISHPDAGKTTLTEKLLLYAGAVELAGSVRARANGRHSTADWLAIERERGITVTSTALQFDHLGCRFNLLDTPGHRDFSEDTYRTLLAADGAVMVLDAARGIQQQTLKLFEVCRRQRLPIVTFINKLDQPGREPLALLDEIERALGLTTALLSWPIGDGPDFQGVYDLRQRSLHRFERTERGQRRAPVVTGALDDPMWSSLLGEAAWHRLREEVALVTEVGGAFDLDRFLGGDQTPVLFGSALTNFGIGPFLDALAELLPAPGPRASDRGLVPPDDPDFSGFIFKIQANMDPRHRDRMAFLRVCSGRFEKDMEVFNPRLGRTVRLTRPHRLFGQDRETVEEAFPGDVVGLRRGADPVHASAAFPAGVLRPHREPQHGKAQAVPRRSGAIGGGGRYPGALLDRRRPRADPGGGRGSPARRHRRAAAGRIRGRSRCQPASVRNRALGGGRRRRWQRAQLADARRATHRGPGWPPGGPLRLRLGAPLHRREEPGGGVPGDGVRRG
jgi:peptide chain release factor 3